MKLMTLINTIHPTTTIVIHKIDTFVFGGDKSEYLKNDDMRKYDHKKVEVVSASGYDVIQINIL